MVAQHAKGQNFMGRLMSLFDWQFVQMRRYGGIIGVALLVPVLSACVTVEGTNALVDPTTFEREVLNQTLQGLGVIDREVKDDLETPRAPLVLPKSTASLPAPTESNRAELPTDSDSVQIDLTGLTEEDLRRLRDARVVDLRSLSGRPLTEAETRQLTARMSADRLQASGKRPLFLPPDRYFTTINSVDLVCLAANGDLVPLDDPRCPPEIRAALQGN